MSSFPKKDLVRVLKTPEGEVILDLSGKKSGRGAYICKNSACLKKALKSKRIQNNLELEIPEEVISQLEKELLANEQ
jgi:predicted RNA-binding protein YlxR (DUF448 family)